MWWFSGLLVLIISAFHQEISAQIPCSSPSAVNLSVIVAYQIPETSISSTGYSVFTITPDQTPLPICLFKLESQAFLDGCGSVATLNHHRDTSPAIKNLNFLGMDNFGRSTASVAAAVVFTSSNNICGLNLLPVRELKKANDYVFTAAIGDDYLDLEAQGYELTGHTVGYTIRCDDRKDQVICANDPTITTTKKTTPKTTTKPCTKKWSEWAWVPGSKCSDTCGSCGKRARQRNCLTCGCTGAAKDTVSCGNPVCYYPRMTCCAGFVKKIDKATNMFICG